MDTIAHKLEKKLIPTSFLMNESSNMAFGYTNSFNEIISFNDNYNILILKCCSYFDRFKFLRQTNIYSACKSPFGENSHSIALLNHCLRPHYIESSKEFRLKVNDVSIIHGKPKSLIDEDLEFVYALKEIEEQDQLKAIDKLYDFIYSLLESDAFFRINSIIFYMMGKKFKLRVLIGLLTITHAKRDNLSLRSTLIKHVKDLGLNEGLTSKQITSILKGF